MELSPEALAVRQEIEATEYEHVDGAPIQDIVRKLKREGMSEESIEAAMDELKNKAQAYEPTQGAIRTV